MAPGSSLSNGQKTQVNTYLYGRMINAMLEHRIQATNSAVVVGVGVTLQSGDLALDMMTAQPYF